MMKKDKTDLLEYLRYMLPGSEFDTTDQGIIATSKYFIDMYGDTILNALWQMEVLPESEHKIKTSDLESVITTIKQYIDLSEHDCYVWQNKNNIAIMSSVKMKPNGLAILAEQRKNRRINPHDFMVEQKQEPNFNNKCIIGMLFQSLLIAFDKLLEQVKEIKQDKLFNINVARLFYVADAITQVDKFKFAFFNRISYQKGAQKTVHSKTDDKNRVKRIVQRLHIRPSDATPQHISDTLKRVKDEYGRTIGKKFNRTDKTLENYILDAVK